MSVNKYADLPDIDTAPDIYETEDVFPSSQANKGDSSDDEAVIPARTIRGGKTEAISKEDIDSSSLMGTQEASKKFRKAERRRVRTHYAYPPSPSSPSSPTFPPTQTLGAPGGKPLSLSARLKLLQNELKLLENELADPTNPQLHKDSGEEGVDAGELIKGLVDVRGRLEKIKKVKEGRGRLVGVVLADSNEKSEGNTTVGEESVNEGARRDEQLPQGETKSDVKSIVDMDKRVGELEKLVGSSSTVLDETSPLPPPLLPSITRLTNQLALLTQPRHIDSISRRLKLLLSDLDRVSASQQHQSRRTVAGQHQPTTSIHNAAIPSLSASVGPGGAAPASPAQLQDQLLPLLSRLTPYLPQIPHILTRLRTLSTLHTSASEFRNTLEALEEEQAKIQEALKELEDAVRGVESSLEDNKVVVKKNVVGLDQRVETLIGRLEEVGRGMNGLGIGGIDGGYAVVESTEHGGVAGSEEAEVIEGTA
ncbi:hypothetical protein AX16_006974 [Volvariella volvacea WC 439]|nr:hypothetical protein AX16_006974 [Volvariella volvacea WC 439]